MQGSTSLNLETFIVAYNESEIIGLTIRHYQQFSKVVVYDNWSTDNTRDIAEELGCEVRLFGTAGILDDQAYLDVKNHCWKESKADFVIVCDCDEILYHPHLIENLERERAFTLFNTQGWEVMTRTMPKELLGHTNGFANSQYSKSVLFSPRLREIDYIFGCHQSSPKGNIIISGFKPFVLHYRYIGGPERIVTRHRMYMQKKLSYVNARWKLGSHYWDKSDNEKVKEWEELFKQCGPLPLDGIITS